MKTVYQCDNCNGVSESKSWIFHCLWCGKEICEDCMFGYATCKECAKTIHIEELKRKFFNQ